MSFKKAWGYISTYFWLAFPVISKWFLDSTIYSDLVKYLLGEEVYLLKVQLLSTIDMVVFIATLIPIAVVSARRSISHLKLRTCQRAFSEYIRESFVRVAIARGLILESTTKDDINIRIFRKKGHYLIFRDREGCFSSGIHGSVKFDTNSNEGLVSKAFLSGKTMAELEDASKKEYNLSDNNETRVGQLKFIVAVPIIEDSGKIRYIIAFDSMKTICTDKSKKKMIIEMAKVPAYDVYRYMVAERED